MRWSYTISMAIGGLLAILLSTALQVFQPYPFSSTSGFGRGFAMIMMMMPIGLVLDVGSYALWRFRMRRALQGMSRLERRALSRLR